MKRFLYFLLLISAPILPIRLFAFPPFLPDEGMWLLTLIDKYNYETMKQMGCKLTPAQIYSEQQPSLKDAIVSLGDFCTAEFVSNDGLLFTNHHCGYDAVANHSTVENNLLENGFWAKDHSQELPNPGLWVKVLIRMQDITDSIVPFTKDLALADQQKKVAELSKILSGHASEDGKYKAEIKSMFYGNQYFLCVYQVFHDVRLVGTPPSSIGRFGGDTDNWMWPRHTCDFSVFRVYADANNNPTSDYAASNVPYHPKTFLPVSLKGLNQGDFAMIVGYPGSTDRYLTSFAIDLVINEANPAQIDIFKTVTDVMKKDMDADPKIKIQLASDYSTLMNSLKLYESQLPGLRKLNLVEKKREQEHDFLAWADHQSSGASEKYHQLFQNFQKDYEALKAVQIPFYYALFNVVLSPSGNFALDINGLEGALAKDVDADTRQKAIDEVKKSAEEYFAKQSPQTEKRMLVSMMTLYQEKRPAEELPDPIRNILAKYKGNTPEEKFQSFVNESWDKSIVTSQKKFEAFITKPSLKTLAKDPIYNYYIGLYAKATDYRPQFRAVNTQIAKDMRTYIQGMMEKDPQMKLYPDANFTMRLTYGAVEPYHPRDAVQYQWMTKLTGVIEKEDSTNEDFKVPAKLKALYQKKDFGRYGLNGDVPACFLTTNDITGGNSGSPVMNGNGELIGLAFDGDYEGTAGDYEVDPELNRTICVDIRYVLFIMDKFADAQNLLGELKVVQ